ncbi:hypothetical protein C7441_12234 [Pseudaminobacter salicylatoxidans]|uniref:Uncharacterized protein n=1 Tax=Pseudaminobacter salicylatoxidans TaxID=93369 RepID=A0A316BT14_PSESE|nr:hypothetical protein C7441_12234 [Pseudaminobacter salicylatoxidans]
MPTANMMILLGKNKTRYTVQSLVIAGNIPKFDPIAKI